MANNLAAICLFMAVLGVCALGFAHAQNRCITRVGRLDEARLQGFSENSEDFKAAVAMAEKEEAAVGKFARPRGCLMYNFTYPVYETVQFAGKTYRCTGRIPISYCVSTRYCSRSYDYFHPLTGQRYRSCRCCEAKREQTEKKIAMRCTPPGLCVSYTYTYTKVTGCDCTNCPGRKLDIIRG